jgi:antitoxin component YwqK of YwqJK toxin-antitoxin module
VFFEPEGNLVRRAQYHGGKLQGETIEHYPSGQIREKAPYDKDLLHGTVQRFHPDGKLKEKQSYREGKPLGPPVEYDGKGRAKAAKPVAPEPGEKKPGWRKKLGLGGGDGGV